MTDRITLFVDVILPLSLDQKFTYRVPFELNEQVQTGVRAVVPLGKTKMYTGLIVGISEQPPAEYQARYIESILDDFPIVTKKQIQFWEWISGYYMANIGDVMTAALPSNFKLASETNIVIHPDFEGDVDLLDEREFNIVEALQVRERLDLKEISEIVGIKTIQPIIKKLIEKRVIVVEEEIQNKYKPKVVSALKFGEFLQNESEIEEVVNDFASKPAKEKQLEILLHLCQRIGTRTEQIEKGFVLKNEFRDFSQSAIKTLEKNGLVEVFQKQISRFESYQDEVLEKKSLSEDQQKALDEIRSIHKEKDIALLHGVTGSGKTEIYVELIEEYIQAGKQVLFLLPEIALTAQLIKRLQFYFGDLVGVYHSKFNLNERVEIWNSVIQNNPNSFRIILGARSSVFLPFRDLGLIIVDEEHENSYKQIDPSPRYNARDTSIVLAKQFGAKIVLGSATPSIETYYLAQSDVYGLVELSKRYGGLQLPEIFTADIRKERARGTMQSHFSKFLIDQIKEALENKEQVILFQNRRGYTTFWLCQVCGWSPMCVNCDVTLTYHKHKNILNCHYCGHIQKPPASCPKCSSDDLKMSGFGTEKIEDELQAIFKDATIQRMDLDTTRSKNAYDTIITDFENREIDVLIGTQMVTKGLDFDNVSLVGIVDADTMLRFPDFRAFERSYQLMSQVSGRSGRKGKRGKVVIQTQDPDQWIIQKVIAHDFKGMYRQEILERKNFNYPPFFRIIEIQIRHKQYEIVEVKAQEIANELIKTFGNRVLGPEFALIPRVRNYYQKIITIKFERKASPAKVKQKIEEVIEGFRSNPTNRQVRIKIDVDPQ
ncbi:MAG: primosomal protein N' [Crocinitomicaceae bacterium]|nr:primosomal protein N' [Crocinitomicaceae bacterium]